MLPYPYMVLNGILYPYFINLFNNNGGSVHLVGSFHNQSLAFADSASSYAYLDIHKDDMASFHIHHSDHDDGDPSLEHVKRDPADLEKAYRLNDDADSDHCTYLFYQYDNGLAYSYDHACLARPHAHDWLYTHSQTCDTDFLRDDNSLGYSYCSFDISSFMSGCHIL